MHEYEISFTSVQYTLVCYTPLVQRYPQAIPLFNSVLLCIYLFLHYILLLCCFCVLSLVLVSCIMLCSFRNIFASLALW